MGKFERIIIRYRFKLPILSYGDFADFIVGTVGYIRFFPSRLLVTDDAQKEP